MWPYVDSKKKPKLNKVISKMGHRIRALYKSIDQNGNEKHTEVYGHWAAIHHDKVKEISWTNKDAAGYMLDLDDEPLNYDDFCGLYMADQDLISRTSMVRDVENVDEWIEEKKSDICTEAAYIIDTRPYTQHVDGWSVRTIFNKHVKVEDY